MEASPITLTLNPPAFSLPFPHYNSAILLIYLLTTTPLPHFHKPHHRASPPDYTPLSPPHYLRTPRLQNFGIPILSLRSTVHWKFNTHSHLQTSPPTDPSTYPHRIIRRHSTSPSH
uniref:Uncharacterized protein n=1 Tax=Knipowitschia caucasica TaxID=637954 RepID=A0AAV2KTD2_KNICA